MALTLKRIFIMAKGSDGGKNKKYGRNTRKACNIAYKSQNRLVRNRLKRRTRHTKRHPMDKVAVVCLQTNGGMTRRHEKYMQAHRSH